MKCSRDSFLKPRGQRLWTTDVSRAPITVSFQRVCIERRGGAILIDISLLYIKPRNYSPPLLVTLACMLSTGLVAPCCCIWHIIGNKEEQKQCRNPPKKVVSVIVSPLLVLTKSKTRVLKPSCDWAERSEKANLGSCYPFLIHQIWDPWRESTITENSWTT